MKKNTLSKKIAALLLACCVMLAGTECFAVIKYEYDAAGNRVKRYEPSSQQPARQMNIDDDEQTIDIFDEQTTGIYEEELPEMKISVTPNPTNGILQVQISHAETLQGAEIRLYSPQGTLIRQVDNLSEITTLDISSQPNGIYIMQVVLDNKEISTWKIIKN